MPVDAQLMREAAGREIGSLALSCVRTENPMALVRAAQWHNTLARAGLDVPFWAVHDLGLLATLDPTSVPMGERPGVSEILNPSYRRSLSAWSATLQELASGEVMEKARSWRLNDELVAVLLLRILGPLFEGQRAVGTRRDPVMLPLDPETYRALEPQLPGMFAATDGTDDLNALSHLARARLRLVIAVEQVDLDTLRLVGMFGGESGAAGALQLLDLLQVFQSPEANDIVNFSLDLLPSILETKRAGGRQTFSVDGYAGLARRGTIDSLMLSELAFDGELFDKRFLEHEVFYYAHERQQEEQQNLHYICVDASASMRGRRSVFARGLALTLLKKLLLQGADVYLRFFDSRLYDVMRTRPDRAGHGGINVPYVLCFKGEHGRNYAKVFTLLADDIQRLVKREHRATILYLITHAECHVPVETIERLGQHARLYGVFMLPSQGELDLSYLDRLDTVQVVDEKALTQRDERARVALDIVAHAADERPARTRPPTGTR